jgi:TMPIT-like protein
LPQFLYFSLGQAIVQFLQYRYQTQRLYQLVAMGKASKMDVAHDSDSNMLVGVHRGQQSGMSSSLAVLAPFLFFVYMLQLYNGYACLMAYGSGCTASPGLVRPTPSSLTNEQGQFSFAGLAETLFEFVAGPLEDLGLKLFSLNLRSPSCEWQLGAIGVLFILLGLGNIAMTSRTYYEKIRGSGKHE